MGLLDALGGRPGETIKLKQQYDMHAQEAMSLGQAPMPWAAWLQSQGYQLGPDNLVAKINQKGGPNQPGMFPR